MTYQQQNRSAGNLPAQSRPQDLRAPEIAMSDIKGAAIGGVMIVPQTLAEIVEFGKLMASAGTMVRTHLRNNPGACTGIAMQAFRWGMDPFAVASKSFLVGDQISYEAQLLAAVVIKNAPIVGRPEYTYSGEKDKRRCKVTVTLADGRELSYESPEIGSIKVKNSPLWTSDPDQQLGYYSVRAMSRRHFPDVLMGVYDIEEAESMRDVTPAAPPQKRRVTDALDGLQARRQPPAGAHIIEGEAEAAPEAATEEAGEASEAAEAIDPDTGEVAGIDIPEMPEKAATAWTVDGKWAAGWKWLVAQKETQPAPVLMNLALEHSDLLNAAAAYNADSAAAVAEFRAAAGI